MENYHLFTIKAIPETSTTPVKVSIFSERHGQEIIVSLTERDAITTASKILQENGYNLVGTAEGQLNEETNIKSMYLISDTFKPFLIKATYVSVWDEGTTIRSKCLYNPIILDVSEVEQIDAEGLELLTDEYLELPDGTRLNRDEFTIDFDVDVNE